MSISLNQWRSLYHCVWGRIQQRYTSYLEFLSIPASTSSGLALSESSLSHFLQRPSAKELLKHRFIKNARKTAKLLERIRFVVYIIIKNWLNDSVFLTGSWSISISISFVSLAGIGRERPKFAVKNSIDATQNGQTHVEENADTGTIKVDRAKDTSGTLR
jgi:hypothetical protein